MGTHCLVFPFKRNTTWKPGPYRTAHRQNSWTITFRQLKILPRDFIYFSFLVPQIPLMKTSTWDSNRYGAAYNKFSESQRRKHLFTHTCQPSSVKIWETTAAGVEVGVEYWKLQRLRFLQPAVVASVHCDCKSTTGQVRVLLGPKFAFTITFPKQTPHYRM